MLRIEPNSMFIIEPSFCSIDTLFFQQKCSFSFQQMGMICIYTGISDVGEAQQCLT
jgi:hypothetical protein